MHGTVRMKVELEGETIVKADPEIGFLHRGFQKSCENVTWTQCLPYTDRLNYVSAMMNNFGFLNAVEKLIGLEIPERAQYIRVIGSELHRMHDHLTCVGAIGLELGGFAAFLYGIEARELIMDRVTELTGARLTTSFGRVGRPEPRPARGLDREGPQDPGQDPTSCSARSTALLTAQPHLRGPHARAPGVITAEDALDFGFTGPCLRACGVNYDIRKAKPYWVYDRIDFDVPLGKNGDNYDRYLMRMEELKQSISIIRQALEQIPAGPDHRRRLAHRAAAQARGVRHHRGRDGALQAGDGGHPGAPRRGLRLHRGRQRRARLVPGERRPRPPVQGPRPRARASPSSRACPR